MQVYESPAEFDEKSDGSPVTQADRQAEAIILQGLQSIAPDISVVSEENAESHFSDPQERYFLVDPLDGTREFIKRDGKGAFTVNIALIESGLPVLGVVYAPALSQLYWGALELGAFCGDRLIAVRGVPETGAVAVASASHRDEQTDQWLREHHISETVSVGSSLKFCLLASGKADVYPRFGPTMEWDTAAGQAVLASAGGAVTHPDGRVFTYGKQAYRNTPFIASGSFPIA